MTLNGQWFLVVVKSDRLVLRVQLVHKVRLVLMVQLARQDQQVPQDHKDQLVPQDHKDQQVRPVLKAPRVIRDKLVLRGHKAM
jgi:hypothetical protein